jgi:hypothetical protein
VEQTLRGPQHARKLRQQAMLPGGQGWPISPTVFFPAIVNFSKPSGMLSHLKLS